ncbi:unnamed protein product [Caenorhabditis bovis]|uniref:Replication termination factor 2 n=1 Tax=Caenorhabditis bovis TaxID=2654633 RepID=A0A8S1F2Z2_9PELO|nr:unnamed protein product [Caenorhabditis bovis]
MGADGGTIPKRCELVKERKKKEKIAKHVKDATKWKNCQLTQLPLRKPVIACRFGKLYNKEDVINAILSKTIAMSLVAAHIKGPKDFVELKLAENKEYKGEDVKGDEYNDVNQTQFMCPITNTPMNGVQNFVVNWQCGCVYSEKAQQEVKCDNCHVCGGPYDPEKIVVLNPDEQTLELYKARWETEKAAKKAAKEAKKSGKVEVEAKPSSSSTMTNVLSGEKLNKKKVEATSDASRKRKADVSDIQSDPTKSDTYKKLFTTCEDAKKKTEGHWMLSVPLRTAARNLVRIPARSRLIVTCQTRNVSTADVFRVSETATPLASDLPPIPTPPPPRRTIEEMIESGESVLDELGLFSWYKPSSYFRVALEGIHNYFDLPWWLTIVSATVALRLLLIGVPIMSQKLVAKQSMYRKELNEFRERIEEARKENNQLLQQQILIEQRDFFKSKDIRLFRQFGIMLANGAVFATQFFAIKKMVEVSYPGLSTGGTLWFTDLTATDPYFALPFISAATMALVTKVGIEMGTTSDQMPAMMRVFMQWGLPVVIFGVSSQFATGLCVYWTASNVMSLIYAGAFHVPAIRKLFNIPAVVPAPVVPGQKSAISQVLKNYKENKSIPPSLADLRQRDATSFKKAGRGKPLN